MPLRACVDACKIVKSHHWRFPKEHLSLRVALACASRPYNCSNLSCRTLQQQQLLLLLLSVLQVGNMLINPTTAVPVYICTCRQALTFARSLLLNCRTMMLFSKRSSGAGNREELPIPMCPLVRLGTTPWHLTCVYELKCAYTECESRPKDPRGDGVSVTEYVSAEFVPFGGWAGWRPGWRYFRTTQYRG